MTADALGNPEPVKVPLDAGANDALEAFGQSILERSREASGSFASALGKARGHALRLSCEGAFVHCRSQRSATDRRP